jgi:drug/metabolite transporter superfamily protein YnfA
MFTWRTEGRVLLASLAAVALHVVFMIGLFQRAGDQWFGRTYLPWGGIGLALTWGTLHYLTYPTLEVVVLPLAMGVVYLLGKNTPFQSFWQSRSSSSSGIATVLATVRGRTSSPAERATRTAICSPVVSVSI